MLYSHSGDGGDGTGCDNTNVMIFSLATLFTTVQQVVE